MTMSFFVQPDLVTGGEAIADMLCNNSTLRYLDISWNTIRLNSAVEIGNSLKINNTLEEVLSRRRYSYSVCGLHLQLGFDCIFRLRLSIIFHPVERGVQCLL